MIRSSYLEGTDCYDEDTQWIKYRSTKVKAISLGYEYEFHTSKQVLDPHKFPAGFIIRKEGLHHRVRGLELKSPVAPLFYHKMLFKKLPRLPWNYLPNGEKNAGGIHVHITKDDVHYKSRDKIAQMFRKEREKLFQISGRTRSLFNEYAKVDPPDGEMVWNPQLYRFDYLDDDGYGTDNCADHDSHYNMLNTEHDRTYEFRLFAAHPKLLMPALEMADSLFMYAKTTAEVTWEGWTSFIKRWPRYRNIYGRVKQCQQLVKSTQN